MSAYLDIIQEAVPEADDYQAGKIEEVMRKDVFHSTLDWQTRDQLKRAAKQAWLLLSLGADLPY